MTERNPNSTGHTVAAWLIVLGVVLCIAFLNSKIGV